jgi:hypothetical protein
VSQNESNPENIEILYVIGDAVSRTLSLMIVVYAVRKLGKELSQSVCKISNRLSCVLNMEAVISNSVCGLSKI